MLTNDAAEYTFEWRVFRPDGHEFVTVIESCRRIDYEREYFVPPASVEGFVKARRAYVYRKLSERGGIKIFMH